jgi:FkbM family methyltransferase
MTMVFIRQVIFGALGNRFAQGALEKGVLVFLYLMGIGSGGNVSSSGERTLFDILKRRKKAPYCIFDVGSNKGQFLQLIIDHLGLDGYSVHCFEPGRDAFKALSDHYRQNRNVIINRLAMGKIDGEAVLYSNAAGSGLASLTKRRLDHYGIVFNESETVEVATIDTYCSQHGINHIHLLKIDIEGHELDALTGAKEMLQSGSIDFVAFEFGGSNIDTRSYFQDYWYLFNEWNMKIFRITPSGYLFPIEHYREINEQFRTTNYVALRTTLNKDYPLEG